VSRVVLLDAGPLGLVTNPKHSPQSLACAQWLQTLVADGVRVILPEIADYEVRRELLRAQKTKGLARLDALARLLEYLPLTTAALRQAALFWALARQQGQPTAGDKASTAT
jgi:predicted nucleic acid-binding protein